MYKLCGLLLSVTFLKAGAAGTSQCWGEPEGLTVTLSTLLGKNSVQGPKKKKKVVYKLSHQFMAKKTLRFELFH